MVIGGKRIKIRVVKDKEDWGEYFHDIAEIHIASRALSKASDLRETLRHEIFEAALHIGGVAWSERYDQEVVVRCVESIFFPCWDKLAPKLNNNEHETNDKRRNSGKVPAPVPDSGNKNAIKEDIRGESKVVPQ